MAVKQIHKESAVSSSYEDKLRFETRRWPYLLSLPLMWALTLWVMGKKTLLNRKSGINAYWFDGISKTCREIKEGAASWRALDIIYNHVFGVKGKITDFWLGMMNAQAVRNRHRLVTSLLVQNLRAMAKDQELRILSLASGSAQSIIEALYALKKEGISVQAVLVDKDPTALANSKFLAQAYGVETQIIPLEVSLLELFRLRETSKKYGPFDIVEMVGFLEYTDDKRLVKLMKVIYSLLAPKGIFLTSSIGNNPERFFLHWVINWKMIYRSREALRALVLEAGFKKDCCEITSEPLHIFHVAICHRL